MDNSVLAVIILTVLGLCFGSFTNAAEWRLRNKKDIVKDRSECVNCHHKLGPADLVPIVSWLALGGKCRYCRKPISKQYPLVEAGVALFFVGSYLFWPYQLTSPEMWVVLILWLIAGVMLAILFVYDAKWYLLPDKVVYPLIGVGAAIAVIKMYVSPEPVAVAIDAILAVLVLAGLYGLLYAYSKGKWVGFGDVKLGIFLGLALTDWQLALVCLFLSNFLAFLFVIPGLLGGKLKRSSKVPFGPFLIAGFVLSGLFGAKIIAWYFSLIYIGIG